MHPSCLHRAALHSALNGRICARYPDPVRGHVCRERLGLCTAGRETLIALEGAVEANSDLARPRDIEVAVRDN